MENLTGSGAGILSSVATGFTNMFFNLLGNSIMAGQQKQANVELANLQNKMNIENWHMQNAYNLPANQMKRLKDAGINPFLVAGSVAGSGNAGSVPGVSPIHSPDYMAAWNNSVANRNQSMRTLIDFMNGIKDIKKKDAEIENTQAATANIKQMTASELWRYSNLFPLNKSKTEKEINNLIERNFLLSLQSQGQSIANSIQKYNLDYMLPLDFEIKRWQEKNWDYRVNQYNPAELALMKARKSLAYSQVALNNATKTYTDARTIGQGHENEWLMTRNQDASDYWKNTARLQVKDIELGTQKYIHDVLQNELYEFYGTTDPNSIKVGGYPVGTKHYQFIRPFLFKSRKKRFENFSF